MSKRKMWASRAERDIVLGVVQSDEGNGKTTWWGWVEGHSGRLLPCFGCI